MSPIGPPFGSRLFPSRNAPLCCLEKAAELLWPVREGGKGIDFPEECFRLLQQLAVSVEELYLRMEHGSITEQRSSTFSLLDEDHTLANSVRFTLNQDPRVEFCGYSIPHPSDNRVNIRVQTTGDPAKDVLKDALQNLMVMCQHVRTTFDKAVADHKARLPKEMDVDRQN